MSVMATFHGEAFVAGAQTVQRDFEHGFSSYGAIYADPPWQFETRTFAGQGRSPQGQSRAAQRQNRPENHYKTLSLAEIAAFPVGSLTRPAPSDAELNARVDARLAQRVYPHRVMGHVQHRALIVLRRQSLTPSELMRAVCVAEQAQIVKTLAGLAFNGAIARDGERWRCVARGAGR